MLDQVLLASIQLEDVAEIYAVQKVEILYYKNF